LIVSELGRNNSIEDFEFTDENGTTYFFTTVEYTDYTLDDDSDFIWHKTNYQYNSVWYLDSIVSANNEEVIVLDYSTISTAYEPPTNPEYYKSLTYNTSGSTVPGGCSSYSLCGSTSSGVLSFASAHVQKVYNRRFLEKVTYRRDGQKIEEIFLHASNYNHLSDSKYNGKRLDSIVVVKGADNPLRVRAFDFTYKSDTELNRLALDNIQEASYDDSQIKHVKPPYEFSYNSTSLPAPTSSSVDHWGYYNTNSHTGSLIPSVTLGCGGSAVTYPGGNANRDPNESRMKAGILERITYPTGGYTDFVFEAHRVEGDPASCSNPIPDRIGGGLRIKEIKNYSSTGNLANKKTYNYKKEGSSYSSGIYMVEPIYYRNSTYYHDQVGTVGGGTCADQEYTCRKITLSSSSRTPLGAIQGSYVGYDRVEEQIYGMGKVVYHYSNKPLSAGFYEIMDNGQLTKKEVYDEDDNQLTETTYTYSTYASDQRRTNSFGPVRVEPSSFQSNQTILCYSSGYYNWKEITDPGSCTESATFESRYEAKPYLIRQRWFKVIKDSTVQKFYSSGGSLLGNVSVLQEFTYGNEAVTLPTKTETTNSDGESYELLVTFPGPSDERGMFLNNKVTAPITKEWKVGGNTIYKNRIDYSSLVPEYYYEKFGSSSELLRETFDLYDEHDNVLEAHKEHDEPISFIWDHYGGTLAAQVKNASQSEIAFTSFESKSTTQGNWYGIDDSKINLDPDFNSDARTGFGYLTGTSSLSTTLVAGDYHLSYYTKNNSNITVTPSPSNTTVHTVDDQGWYYVEHTFSFSGSETLQVSVSNTRIDELRVHPVDAEMVTFSHDQRTHLLISMADEHSVHQRFSYDSLLRLETVRDYNLDHIEAYAYEYDVSGSSPLNRIKSWMVEKVGVKNFDNGAGDKVVNLTGEDVIRMYSYVDGLGRPVQTIGVGQSPSSTISNNKDIVSHIAYDAYGRQNKQFLPYTIANSTPGAFRSSAATEQSSFYSGIDGGYGYTEYEFDDSPLNRIFVEKPEGSVYRSHPREVEYYANSANEVRDFESGGYYPANTLFETRVLDENNRYTTTYVDKLGRKVMENNGGARTYFIYDDFGALKAVITPEGAKLGHSNSTWLYTHSSIKPKSYEYTYDATLHRLIEKKVPGSDAYEYYYDRLDRPVLTVDGNGFKTFTKFDALGRPIMTGRYTGSSNTISGSLPLFESKTSSGPHYYTNSAFPTSNFDVYTVTYYDNYDIDENGSLSSAESYRIPPTGYDSPVYRSRGLPTVEKTAVLNNNGTAPSTYLFTRMFYDLKKRMVQTYSQNQLSGSDRIYEAYSFSGRLEKSKREHSATLGGSGKSTTIEKSYSYDHSGRLLEIAQATDGGAFQTIVQHEYDERTNLSTKKLHNTTGSSYLYELDYTYNIRGWLEQINTFDDPGMIFAMQLHYGEGDEDLSSAYEDGDDANYNGNITMLEWQVGENGDRATYGLLYDPLNRLDGAVYGFYEPPYGYNRNYRYELSVDYDQNGNITDFWRRGETGSPGSELFSVIDNMDYTYDSEGKLSSVYENSSTTYGYNGSGATANYTYDNNGNLISDTNRGISSVDYNHLNLPTKVTYSGGQWIEWTYDALGTKLQKSTSTGDDRYYEGDIEYQNTSLAVIYHEEGFLQPDGSSGFDYYYYLRDHLGNTRLIVQDANSNGSLDVSEIVQENHYYPFGMQMQGDWMGSSVDNYTYNGKEWNDDFGLDWLDYGARMYDPAIGRWNAVDPLAENYSRVGPYNYVLGNPISLFDPDGMQVSSVGGAITFTGEDAVNAFKQIQNNFRSNQGNSNKEEDPDPSLKKALGNAFNALADSRADAIISLFDVRHEDYGSLRNYDQVQGYKYREGILRENNAYHNNVEVEVDGQSVVLDKVVFYIGPQEYNVIAGVLEDVPDYVDSHGRIEGPVFFIKGRKASKEIRTRYGVTISGEPTGARGRVHKGHVIVRGQNYTKLNAILEKRTKRLVLQHINNTYGKERGQKVIDWLKNRGYIK
jgi:RHS repeat-associated protein